MTISPNLYSSNIDLRNALLTQCLINTCPQAENETLHLQIFRNSGYTPPYIH